MPNVSSNLVKQKYIILSSRKLLIQENMLKKILKSRIQRTLSVKFTKFFDWNTSFQLEANSFEILKLLES